MSRWKPKCASISTSSPPTASSPARGSPQGSSASAVGLCVVFLEDLREVEARVRTEKLASMGRMSAAVAHEIRNPLSAITQANALLDEEVSDPGQKRLTRMIEQNAQRLSRIVDDILNVARAQPSSGESHYRRRAAGRLHSPDCAGLDAPEPDLGRAWRAPACTQDVRQF